MNNQMGLCDQGGWAALSLRLDPAALCSTDGSTSPFTPSALFTLPPPCIVCTHATLAGSAWFGALIKQQHSDQYLCFPCRQQ